MDQTNLLDSYIKWRSKPAHDANHDSLFCTQNSIAITTLRTLLESSDRDIDREVIAERRATYSDELLAIDKALLDKALLGDVAAAKLFYMRFDGWNPKLVEVNDNRKYTFVDIIKSIDNAKETPLEKPNFEAGNRVSSTL